MRLITKSPDVLANAKEIPWLQGLPTKKGERGYNWSFPVDSLFMGHDWYSEKYEILHAAPTGSVIIDVGCKIGDWTRDAKPAIPPGVLKIGVDPIDYKTTFGIVDRYFSCAIDNVDQPTTMTLNYFDEAGCNSLRPKSDHLSMRTVLGQMQVPVKSLEKILLECVAPGTRIHYLKCDCQGKDADVAKSLKSFLPHTKYIQIECSFSQDQPFYIGQPSYEQDVLELQQLGFEPIYFMDYALSPLPEGEILFKNKSL